MSLTQKEIEHLAMLARLKLTSAEIDEYAGQLSKVLAYVAKLQEIKGNDLKDKSASVRLRPDIVKEWPNIDELIKLFPQRHDNYLIVPEVLTDKEDEDRK